MALKSKEHGLYKEVKKRGNHLDNQPGHQFKVEFIEFLFSAFFFMLHLKWTWNENSQYLFSINIYGCFIIIIL